MRLSFLPTSLFFALIVLAGCDSTDTDATVRVMSQNLYLGGDLFTVTAEANPQMVPLRVAELYATIEASDPAERMAALAAEIARVRPDLVGLQEVSTYYVQQPGDNLPGGAATQATTVTYDFLALLLDALEAEGVTYSVASRSDNSDVELPATTNGQTFFDVRYRDADVILARSGVQTSGASETEYVTLVTVTVAGQDLSFVRSYQSVRATVGDATFRFFNTHLEVGGQAGPIQEAQGAELKAALGTVSGPAILVGDLNSDAGGTGTATYSLFATDYRDAAGNGTLNATCCQAADLRNGTSSLTTRIDLIFSRGFDLKRYETVLDAPSDRTDSGLWPSDHAGVWADLELTEAGAEDA